MTLKNNPASDHAAVTDTTPEVGAGSQRAIVRASRRMLQRVGLVLFGIFVGLLLFEGAVRILESASGPTRYRDFPTVWYLPEGSLDNRDYYYPRQKPTDTYRIVVVGDSFTYGGSLQFYDNFAKRLERTLNLNEKQRRVEVMNWGVPGYATFQEAELVRRAMKNYDPDLVILQITLNDPEIGPYRQTHKKSWLERMTGKTEIFDHWRSLKFVANRIHNSIANNDYMDHYRQIFEPSSDNWKRFSESIHHIAAMSEEYKKPVLSVVFPLFSHTVNSHYPFASMHEQILAQLIDAKLPFLDLREAFNNIPHERLEVIIGEDPHPNLIAHALAADAIYRDLERRKMVPEDTVVKNQKNRRQLLAAYPGYVEHKRQKVTAGS